MMTKITTKKNPKSPKMTIILLGKYDEIHRNFKRTSLAYCEMDDDEDNDK